MILYIRFCQKIIASASTSLNLFECFFNSFSSSSSHSTKVRTNRLKQKEFLHMGIVSEFSYLSSLNHSDILHVKSCSQNAIPLRLWFIRKPSTHSGNEAIKHLKLSNMTTMCRTKAKWLNLYIVTNFEAVCIHINL